MSLFRKNDIAKYKRGDLTYFDYAQGNKYCRCVVMLLEAIRPDNSAKCLIVYDSGWPARQGQTQQMHNLHTAFPADSSDIGEPIFK
jgi:hypothetical protein